MEIRDGAEIFISSTGQGDGATLSISTDSLTLDNGFINSGTSFGVGANVDLQINNNLVLDNNSQISALAFNNADGGNVNIESGIILAFPSTTPGNGNDIIARAEPGEGGNIVVTADFVLGIEERPATPGNGTNDIDASSQFSSNSILENIFVDTNISEANVLESNQIADRVCRANPTIARNSNTFTIKGKGGVPPAPNLPLSVELLLIDGKPITPNFSQLNNHQTTQNITSQIQPVKTSQGDIYPARGIIKTEDGRIILTAYPTNNNATRNPTDAASCHQVE
ncbi:MAG: hypothetical protein QNJ32_01150 [Xenococcaceae cyanobacterium MO_167.B27]|nr:hypothetical protein [Xenococcaceae cyanobacterium MO_167.B27]